MVERYWNRDPGWLASLPHEARVSALAAYVASRTKPEESLPGDEPGDAALRRAAAGGR